MLQIMHLTTTIMYYRSTVPADHNTKMRYKRDALALDLLKEQLLKKRRLIKIIIS